MIKSNTAIRLKIDNTPTREHLENLKIVAKEVFQPIRDRFYVPIYVSSGYRSEKLNKAVGGSKTSHHSRGMALDIDQDGRGEISNTDVFNFILNNLKFTQLIWEFGDNIKPDWIHVSYDPNDLRGEALRSVKNNGRTEYQYYS